MKNLTVLEQTLLATIISLKDDAYGVSIRKTVRKKTGGTLLYGTLYRALDQLTKKAYVNRKKGEATAQRDGSQKVFYTATLKGRKALHTAFKLQKAIRDIIPEFSTE